MRDEFAFLSGSTCPGVVSQGQGQLFGCGVIKAAPPKAENIIKQEPLGGWANIRELADLTQQPVDGLFLCPNLRQPETLLECRSYVRIRSDVARDLKHD